MSGGSVHGRSVSVIIPVWNGSKYLPACLDAVLAQSYPGVEVIVVDNASVDGSADLVTSRYPQVRVVRNRENAGFAGGCNAGMQVARGQILVLLNQDTSVCPGWLEALVGGVLAPEVGVAGCKILYPDEKMIQHAGGWVEWPLGLAHHYGRGEEDVGQWDDSRPVEYVTGAAMAIRREVAERLGGLDEGFWPGYYEDVDFCFAARECGYGVQYVPAATLAHHETTSTGDAMLAVEALCRGRLRFLIKHMPLDDLLQVLTGEERVYYLQSGEAKSAHALRMAYLETIPAAAALLPLRQGANYQLIDEVLEALQRIYLLPTPTPLSANPPLHEFEFHSMVPVLGPWIGGIRRLWYGVAARWAVRALMQQQEAINQHQAATDRALVRSLVSLSRTVAHVLLRSTPGQ